MHISISFGQHGLAKVGLGGRGWAKGVREGVWGWMCFGVCGAEGAVGGVVKSSAWKWQYSDCGSLICVYL